MEKTLLLNGYAFDFELIVRDMYNQEIPFVFKEDMSSPDKYVFRGTGQIWGSAWATVSVEQRDNTSAIRFYCDTAPFCGYDVSHYLAAYDAAEIRLTPHKEPDAILASVFHLGKKSDCWTKPYHLKAFHELPSRAISLAWKCGDKHHHLLSMCNNSAKTDMKVVNGAFTLVVSPYRSGIAKIDHICVTAACEEDPYAAAKTAVEAGYRFLNRRPTTTENTRLSDVFQYLGWCSWDSMRTEVTEEGLLQKADEFNEKGIPVRWFLIDDGWFTEDRGRHATSFKEEPTKFPSGLKYCVERLKTKNNMKYVGAWEALAGAWRGIAPDSEILREHADKLFRLPNGYYFPRTDEGSAFAFWNARHAYLSQCGIDFVKIDVECCVESTVHGVESIADAAAGMHKGIDGSVGIYFDGACINCTGMGAEALWNRPVGMVNRNSEDFDPGDVTTMSNFVNCNLYNSLWHSQFNATDWDMMWSNSPTTKLNVVMHAISGAVVYLSDPHGISSKDYILPFCLSDGKLLKADRYAVPTEDCLYRDPIQEKIALKAWSMSGKCGVLGVFNTYAETAQSISDSFKPSDIPYIEGETFIVYDYFAKTAHVAERDEICSFTLDEYDAKLFLIVPYIEGIAMLGNVDKYVSPAVIEEEIRTGDSVMYLLTEGGKIAFAGAKEAFLNGKSAEIQTDGILSYVDCSAHTGKVILTLK